MDAYKDAIYIHAWIKGRFYSGTCWCEPGATHACPAGSEAGSDPRLPCAVEIAVGLAIPIVIFTQRALEQLKSAGQSSV